MSAPATIDQFLNLVRESRLIDTRCLETQLERLRRADVPPDRPRDVADALRQEGLLTVFQAEQLLLGNCRGFSVGRYKILRRLGSGVAGTVYLCEQESVGRNVAVKVLSFATEANPSTVARFKREARALASLDHPNVVKVFDFDQDGDRLFLVMEFVDGITLRDLVKQQGPLQPGLAAHYVRQVAKGLHHVHEAGLVHRDVKPGNLMVDARGTIKILDLGLARFLEEEGESLTVKYDGKRVLGTPEYLAPEQAQDSHDVDARADVYGLGATFYYLLAGVAPFHDGTVMQKLLRVQTQPPRPLLEHRPDLPRALVALVGRMMARDRDARFATLAEADLSLATWARVPVAPPTLDATPRPQARGLSASSLPPPRKGARTMPALQAPTADLNPEPPGWTERALNAVSRTFGGTAAPASAEPDPARVWWQTVVTVVTLLASVGLGIAVATWLTGRHF
jgi:eukaryotic-like serine/threonine-protein kinase